MKTGTKFWMAVGVEAVLVLIILLVIAVAQEKLADIFKPWLVAFVGVPLQYGLFNVIASGQASAAATGVPPEPPKA